MNTQRSIEEIQGDVDQLRDKSLKREHPENIDSWQELLTSGYLDFLPAGFSCFDNEFRLNNCNNSYAEFIRLHTPFKPCDALGMCHFDYKPGSESYLLDLFRQVRESNKAETIYDLEVGINKNDIFYLTYWDVHLAPLRSMSGRQRGLLMCCIEVTERNLTTKILKESEKGLPVCLLKIKELKSALKVLSDIQKEERKEFDEKLQLNLNQGIMPYIEKLKTSKLDADQLACVDVIESSLCDILSPLGRNLCSGYRNLTPAEIQVAELIKQGRQSKEMSDLLKVSKECIDFHRGNIRKKLGLTSRKTNLQSFLLSLARMD